MATLRTSLALYDGMTSPLMKITNAMNMVISGFESMQDASGKAIDTASLSAAREELSRAEIELRSLEAATERASGAQREYNHSLREGKTAASGLGSTLRSLVATYLSFQSVKGLFGLSDELAQTEARLNLVNEKFHETLDLQRLVYQTAQGTGSSYLNTAAAVAKMGLNAGSSFSGGEEVIAFMDQVNKHFLIGGASAEEQRSAVLQLTQAMGAGALRGEELNSVLDAAPSIARAIEESMGWAEGSIKQYAEQGLVTASVVKEALFSTADETNEKFEKLPLTWSRVWNMAANFVIQAAQPILDAINWLANNLSIIGPLVLGVGAAFAVFLIAANWTKIAGAATAAYTFLVNVLNAAYGALTGNTLLANAAAASLNATMLASPITWIVIIVLLLVAALYAGVAAFNRFSDASVSATGIIAGTLLALLAHAVNTFLIPFQNQLANFANFFGNLFNDPVAAIKILFLDMATTLLGYIKTVAHGMEDLINKIPGMEVNLTSGIDDLYNRVKTASQEVKDASGWTEYVEAWDYIDLTGAFQTGYGWGAGLEEKISGMFDFDFLPDLSGVGPTLDGIADDTAAISDSVEISQEDLKYLRDIANREAINRFTTAQIRIDQRNENHIGSELDVDGIMDRWTEGFVREMNVSGEGVHF